MAVTHLNSGATLVLRSRFISVTHKDAGHVQKPAEADQVIWGQMVDVSCTPPVLTDPELRWCTAGKRAAAPA